MQALGGLLKKVMMNSGSPSNSVQVAEFLRGRRGVYTTMRTVNVALVFGFEEHVRRLCLVRQAAEPDGGHAPLDEEAMRRRVSAAVREAMLARGKREEMRVSAAVRVREGARVEETRAEDVEMMVVVEALAEKSKKEKFGEGVACELAEGHRDNPTVKHGEWIEQRKELEKKMRGECEEALLVDKEGNLFEGLSSNLGVVDRSGVLFTAPENTVLTGTVLQLVKEVCRDEQIGVRVEHQCPTVDMLRTGQASLFISSTSRLVMPVTRLYLLDGTPLQLPVSDLTKLLVTRVRHRIDSASSRVLEETDLAKLAANEQ